MKSYSRVFALGIGNSVSRGLVNGNIIYISENINNLILGLARAGGGTAVFVKQGEKMESKVLLFILPLQSNNIIIGYGTTQSVSSALR